MTRAPWLRRHPLLGYFALTYGISWGGILVVLGSTGFAVTLVDFCRRTLASRFIIFCRGR